MRAHLAFRSLALVPISSIREAVQVISSKSTLPTKLEPGTADFRLFATCFRLMNKEFYQPNPDLSSLTCLLDKFRQSGLIPASSWDQQLTDLYMRFRAMATRSHSSFSTSDLTTVIWRLQQARIHMDTITLRDFAERIQKEITENQSQLTAETVVRAMEAFACMNCRPEELLYETVLPAFQNFEKTQNQVIRLLVAMCIFGEFRQKAAWMGIIDMLQPSKELSYLSLQRLRMLHYVLSVEYPGLLTQVVGKETVSARLLASDSLISKENTSVPALEDDHKAVLSIHDEVKYVLSRAPSVFPSTEHCNIGNGFLVDFAHETNKICIDIDAPHHYYRPGLASTYLELGNNLLNGFTVMKYRTLVKAGWKLVQIPFFEWNNFSDETEKRLYLSRKLRTLQKVYLPKPRTIK